MKSKINANRALMAEKSKLTKLFTLLAVLIFGISNVWADETYYLQDPAETNGTPALTGDFYTTCPLSFSVSKTYETVTYKKGLTFSGNLTSMGSNCKNPNYQVRYDCKTNNTSITVIVYNKHSSNAKKLYRYTIQENSEIGEANTVSDYLNETITKNSVEAKTYEVKNSTRTSIYFAIEDKSNQSIVQIIAVEKGTKFPEPGEDGYQINFNKMRYVAPSGSVGKLDATSTIEGVEMYMNDDGYYNKTAGKIQTNNTHYIKFSVAQKMMLSFVTSSTKSYTVGAKGSTAGAITPTANKAQLIKIAAAGTYYINPQGSNVTPTGMSFYIPTISYDKNDEDASGAMSSNTWTVAANGFTAPSGKKFDKWNTKADGSGDDVAVGDELLENTTLYAQWKADVEEYAITEATSLTGGSVDASAAIKAAGETVTITATPDIRYIFDAWDVYKTGDPTTKVSVTETAGVYTFKMPAYPVTVSATFTADSRKQILYLTTATTEGDKLYEALNADANYNVIVAAPASQALTNYDLVVLHESISGNTADPTKGDKKQVILDIPTTTIPVLNTKSYFYTSARWNWGNAANGKKTKGMHINTAYSNITSHPLFAGLTPDANDSIIVLSTINGDNKPMQPVTSFTSGKEGYTLANVPDGCAIHELTPAQRGVASGKYLLISIYNKDLNNLNADGQKLFKNAAEYLMGATAWVPAAPADDDATLKALSVAGLTLTPAFDADEETYTVTKAYGADDPVVSDVTATPTADGASAEVEWDGTNKKFTITVTALDATTKKTYTITVNEAEAPKSLSRVLFSNGFDAFIDNTNHTVKAYYLAGATAPTATTITAGAGTAGELSEGKIRVTGADDSYVDYIVTLAEVTPNTTSVAEADPAGEFAGDEAWVKNGLLVYGNAAGYSAGDKWYVNRRLTKGTDPEDDQRVIAGWVRSYFFVGNASKFIMTIGGNKKLDYTIDGGTPVENVEVETLEIALTKGNHMIEIVSHQQSGDCRLSAPKLVELPPSHTVTYKPGEGSGAWVVDADAIEVADVPGSFTAPTGKVFNGWKNESDDSDVAVGAAVATDMNLIAQWINHYAVTFNMNGHGDAIDPQDVKEGAKAAKPDDPSESGYDFGGWFTDDGTFEAPFDFNTPITAATPLYAKWTADPCPDKKSIVKAVMATNTTATVTGYNSNEYAGGYIVNNLADDASNTNMYDFGEGEVKGFKLKGSNSAIFATLSKGGFVAGDQVVFAVTKNSDANKLAIYAAKDKDHVLKLVELDVDAAGNYTYRLTQDNIDAIEAAGSDYLSIGTFRGDYNPYIYSVELKGCRSWAIFHTLTFKNIDGTATIATESLEEGAYASTVAPAAPKITLKRFLGWAEAINGTPVDLTAYTITEDKTLYAVYEDIVCPTTGTVYKFEIKDELPSENLPTSTDKDMSSYITATGDGYLTYTATANNKATINSDGTIQMKDASAAYLKVELECALAAGDQIRAHVTNNPMRVQVGTTYDSNKDLILAKNAYEFVAITSAMEGKQVLYITRSTNGNANLADFEIYRPAKYDVSFNMMGHGSAIADLEDVLEGSKITAPSPAPTDADYSFAGWYKENTLENEWNFDVDVVNDNITLYAKWLDKSDATLKSLKYGETEITLEVGVYTYNVSLPAFTSAVPALTAETSNPNATKVIANAAAFDSEGNATSTVTVTPEVGADRVYTVNFAKGVEILLQDVTKSTTWNFANAVTGTVNITGTPQVLANYGGVTNDNTFESDKLEASGEKFSAGTKANLRANYIHFHTTVPGMLTISYSNTGGNPARFIYVNGVKYDEEGSANTTPKGADKKVLVPAGDVELVMKDGEDASKNVQIYQIIFKAPDYMRSVTNNIGTLCVDHNVPAGGALGATFYQIAGKNAEGKLVFDEVTELVAGQPYIFQSTTGGITLFYGETTAPDPVEYKGMVGSFSDKHVDIDDSNKTNIMYIASNKLWDCSDLTPAPGYLEVVANRAYIFDYSGIGAAPAHAPGKRYIVVGKDQATGFDQLDASETPMKLIIDGQLFILRGEKMYNANGQLVK